MKTYLISLKLLEKVRLINYLDVEIEKNFLSFLNEHKKKITIIFVIHKKNALENLDVIYEISKKTLIRTK